MLSIRKILSNSLVSMIILSMVILGLLISVNKVSAADLQVVESPTQFLLQGQLASFNGYLISPLRFEKTIIAIADLQSTKENSELKSRLLAIAEQERDLVQQRLDVQKQDAAAVEKGLSKKIADLDVWYKKPYVVAIAVAVVFIATGLLFPY